MHLRGLGRHDLVDELTGYMQATVPVKVGVKRTKNSDGSTDEHVEFIDVRDNRAWGDAIKVAAMLLGFMGRRGQGPGRNAAEGVVVW